MEKGGGSQKRKSFQRGHADFLSIHLKQINASKNLPTLILKGDTYKMRKEFDLRRLGLQYYSPGEMPRVYDSEAGSAVLKFE